MEIIRLPARALYCHVTGERSQGRQAKKWIENIKEDFELRNIQFKDAIARRKDRTAWRQTANIINLIVIVMTDEKEERTELTALYVTIVTIKTYRKGNE